MAEAAGGRVGQADEGPGDAWLFTGIELWAEFQSWMS